MKTYSVKLRVFKGKKTYDENGNITSQNHTMDAPIYESLEWNNFMKNFTLVGYIDVKVEKVSEIIYTEKKKEGKEGVDVSVSYEPLSESDEKFIEVVQAVEKAKKPEEPKAELTAEQKRIAELEAQNAAINAKLDAVLAGQTGSGDGSKTPTTDDDIDDIQELRDKYILLTGEEPDKRWKEKKLKEKIAQHEASKED